MDILLTLGFVLLVMAGLIRYRKKFPESRHRKSEHTFLPEECVITVAFVDLEVTQQLEHEEIS